MTISGSMSHHDYSTKKPINQTVLPRPVTSLEHQVGRRVFWEGPKFFKLCPTVFNFAQQIFPGGSTKFAGEASPPFLPWLRACVQCRIKWTRGPGQNRDREAPQTLSATAKRFTCPRFNFAEAPVKNVKTDAILQPALQFRDCWGWPCTADGMCLICPNMQWWDCSSLMSTLLCLQTGCKTCYRIVLLLVLAA